ncbi:MAG: hypothetical protein DHS20C18_26730 [Saprospiraceae bacterium]|nr:MAG: hypothetical protein DHS20C18_26730 [Saprospiraceae bacterium]
MAAPSNLFVLVKSLTRSEKRYFTIFNAGQGGEDTNYLRLFEFLDKMHKYDKEEIQEAFAEEFEAKKFHVLQNYLYTLILRALRAYNDGKDIEANIQNMIQEADLLEKRGMYKQSAEHLNLARRKAEKYEKTYLLLAIKRRELSFTAFRNEALMVERIDEISKDLDELIQKITLEHIAMMTYYKIGTLSRKATRISQEQLDSLKSKWQQEISLLGKTNLPFTGKYFRFLTDAYLAKFSGNYQEFSDLLFEVVKIWSDHPHHIKDQPHRFRIYLSNYLDSLHGLGDFSHSQAIIEILEGRKPSIPFAFSKELSGVIKSLKFLEPRNFNEEGEFFQSIAFLKLFFYLNTKNWGLAQKEIEWIEKGMSTYKEKINRARELVLYYLISLVYFMLDDTDRALHWLLKIINQSRNDHRRDLQRFAPFLQLMFFIDQGLYELARDKTNDLRRRMKRKDDVSTFEKLILDHLKGDIFAHHTKKVQKKAFEAFAKDLHDFKVQQNGVFTLGLDETEIWIEKNIKKLL